MAGTRGRKGTRQRGVAAVKTPSAEDLQARFVRVVEAYLTKIEAAVSELKPSEADFASVATSLRAAQPAMLLARELVRPLVGDAAAGGEVKPLAEAGPDVAQDPAAELRGLKLRTG